MPFEHEPRRTPKGTPYVYSVAHDLVTPDDARAILALIPGWRGQYWFSHVRRNASYPKETRKVFTGADMTSDLGAIGLVFDSAIQRAMVTTIMMFSPPPAATPIKVFGNEGDALAWFDELERERRGRSGEPVP